MGRQYYCEYCDRAFTDVPDSRKKHLKGVSHERLKKLYYSRVRDLKSVVQEERQKEVCRRFRNTGFCPFEEACTFTHYSHQELTSFELEIEEQERKKNKLSVLPSVQEWLMRRKMKKADQEMDVISIYGNCNPLKNYNYHSLPPSLKPIPFEEMENLQFVEWG